MNGTRKSTLPLAACLTALAAAAGVLREDEVTASTDAQRVEVKQSVDLRDRWIVEAPANGALSRAAGRGPTLQSAGAAALETESDVASCDFAADADLRAVFPVAQLENDPALRNFAYSAVGWDLAPAADAARTVTITARAGTCADGVCTPDGGAAVTVLAATPGSGTFDWRPAGISKKTYQLVHAVRKNGVLDEEATLYGYLDFSRCAVNASETDVRMAVLGAVTHQIVVVQDADAPWQPIDLSAARSGVATAETLAPGTETATAFAFNGRGVLHYECRLTGGTLEVVADGGTVSVFAEPTAGWVSCSVSFAGYGGHSAAFVHAAAAGGGAAIRGVRWEVAAESPRMAGADGDVRVDLQEGVRTPPRFRDVLPFEYSSTNWIGDVVGVDAESVARIEVVQLTGTNADVRVWTDEVPGTSRELVKRAGESSARWRPRRGVWKATFDVLDGDAGVHRETALFDLRRSRTGGVALILK